MTGNVLQMGMYSWEGETGYFFFLTGLPASPIWGLTAQLTPVHWPKNLSVEMPNLSNDLCNTINKGKQRYMFFNQKANCMCLLY